MMGSPEAEAGRRSDERQVFVEITRPFQISEVAVTEEQWARVMGLSSGHGDGRPAVKVNWQQACLFCELLTAMEREAGLIDAGQAYRLPTEAEWEYCCRAGSSIAYSFGEDACELSDYALYYGVTYERLGEHPEEHVFNCTADDQGYIRDYAGEKTPNAWGLHDMHGNVLEWCADWYAEQLGGGENPRGPFTGTERVCRGGYCWSSEADCRSAARSHELPIRSCCYIGFRVVLGAAT
jgi:formylglycine-generating enzyme required for sulfatase activity